MKRLVAIAALTSALAGCSAAPDPEPTPEVTAAVIPAEKPCKLFSELVLSPIANGEVAFNDGRATRQELDGFYRLGAFALTSLEAQPGTGVADALATAQSLNQVETTYMFDPTTPEWADAVDGVANACAAEGFEVFVNMWSGG
jgi:hypothetical protein